MRASNDYRASHFRIESTLCSTQALSGMKDQANLNIIKRHCAQSIFPHYFVDLFSETFLHFASQKKMKKEPCRSK